MNQVWKSAASTVQACVEGDVDVDCVCGGACVGVVEYMCLCVVHVLCVLVWTCTCVGVCVGVIAYVFGCVGV